MNTITKIAISNDRKNKTGSILIMLSIFLTTMLLTIIWTLAYGFIKDSRTNAGAEYGSYYGIYQSVTMEQIQEMNRHSEFSSIGLMASAGLVEGENRINLMSVDETARKLTNADDWLADGRYPVAENEILAQPSFFAAMGYENIKAGDEVTLPYRINQTQKYEARTFVVSGLLRTQNTGMPQNTFTVYTSMAFFEAQYEEENRTYYAVFTLNEHVSVTFDNVEEVLKTLAKECGIEEKGVSVNSYYLIWMLDPGYETISICAVIAIIVILFSVVIIYNIFQVGIVQKIQEYGKIRALGAAKKQMRRLIYREGMFLAALSIPTGVIVGFGIAAVSFTWLINRRDEVAFIRSEQVSVFSIPVLIFSAFLAFITVVFALRRPMKIVASISPVEAIRYQEHTGKKHAGVRKGRNKVSVFSLAMANIMNNRRRTVMTILTMGLSCVLFVVLANCVGNMDAEYDARKQVPHGQFQIELDGTMNDTAYPENNLNNILKNNPLNAELIARIQEIPGVTGVQTRPMLAAQINGRWAAVSVLDEIDFEREKNSGSTVGRLNYADSEAEDIFYYGWSYFMEDDGYTVGSSVTMELTDGTDTVTCTGGISGAFGSAAGDWVITEDMYQRMFEGTESVGFLWVDCDAKNTGAVRQSLEELTAGLEHVNVTVYEEVLQRSEMGLQMMKISCYLFLAIIGLIGFLNLANTMIMNIITRKHEYGILQAVGMTNRQLNASLQIQGLLFTVGTAVIAVLAGLPMGYGLFQYGRSKSVFGLNVYHVPYMEIGLMIAAIVVLQFVLSCVLSRNVKKESLVERIRYQE